MLATAKLTYKKGKNIYKHFNLLNFFYRRLFLFRAVSL